MRLLALAGLIGLAVATFLIARHGMTVLSAAASLGWTGLAAVLAAHLVQVTLSAAGWRAALSPLAGVPLRSMVYARWVRESVNSLLPVAQVGGDVVGARLLVLRGVAVDASGAGVAVDLSMEVVTQVVFTVIGLALALASGHRGPVIEAAGIGLVVFAIAVAGFLASQHLGLFRLLERFVDWLLSQWPDFRGRALEGLHEGVQRIYARRSALLQCSGLHLLSWLVGGIEVWLSLKFIGAPIGLAEALIIESLIQAVRSAAFFVPGALGVQEGGLAVFVTLFGLPPDIGLALSLVKRMRELALGLPGLLAWQAAEGGRLLGWRSRAGVRRP
ncbi:MAG: lysylphosphatidylglycerol synthase domain-containing protein [Gammaproteobacteria bacterium]